MTEPSTGTAAPRSRRGPLAFGLVVLAVAIGIGVWYAFLADGDTGANGTPPDSDVIEFSGSGDRVTDSFTVTESWQIRWETEGDLFAFAIRGDTDIGEVLRREGPGTGITSPVPTGTFFLEITAEGPWSIRITQGD